MAAQANSEPAVVAPNQTVLARAKQAIANGNRPAARALLHVLLTDGPGTAATLTTALAQAMIATARAARDTEDELASRTFHEAYIAREEICRLLGTAPLDIKDLAVIRSALERRQQHLEDEQALRLAEQRADGSSETLRPGLGWLERYLVGGRWGPYLRLRWREENGRKRMKYIGKLPE
jgi:hypothetical protein